MSELHDAVEAGDTQRIETALGEKDSVNEQAGSAQLSPLHVAAAMGSVTIAKRLLEAGAFVDARSVGDDTPLHIAAYAGVTEMIGLLLAAGADPNAQNRRGETPLHLAAGYGGKAAVAALRDVAYPMADALGRFPSLT